MNKFAYSLAILLLPIVVFAGRQADRNPAEAHAFLHTHPCPGGPDKGSTTRCHGYVIDHVKPLDCGGPDDPSNMQYQTVLAGHAKDKWERNGKSCKHRTHAPLPKGVHLNY